MSEVATSEVATATQLLVRPASRTDAATLIEFNLQMAREVEGLELDPAVVRRGVHAVFDDPRKGDYWIAEREGEVIGSLLTGYEWSVRRNGRLCWLLSLYVVPEARGRWIYNRLMEHVRRTAKAQADVVGILLYVDKRNLRAQRIAHSMRMIGDRYVLYEWLK